MSKKSTPAFLVVVPRGDVRRVFHSVEEVADWLRHVYEGDDDYLITIEDLETSQG